MDLCILCGCDYTGSIEGIGPIKAFKYMKEMGTIEKIIEKIESDNLKRKKKYLVPSDFNYSAARSFFLHPDVTPPEEVDDFKWDSPHDDDLKLFLVEKKGFAENRVESGIKRLKVILNIK